MQSLIVILGNQLFDYKHYNNLDGQIFMSEDYDLCTHFKYHKHKIIHFLSGMRNYSDFLKSKNRTVHYFELSKKTDFFKNLKIIIKEKNITSITIYEIEDIFFEIQFFDFVTNHGIELKILKSPMFMCTRVEFREYLKSVNKPFMKTFYEGQRKKHNILMDGKHPYGGKWSYDTENRKKIPKKEVITPFTPKLITDPHTQKVKELVHEHFSDHPGSVDNFWIPINRKDSITWFKKYLKTKFQNFGTYQDAIDTRCDFLFHSLLSPLINIGFLTPDEVVREVEKLVTMNNLNSVEGFIRQVMGWREFVRGIYQNFDHKQQNLNFFNHQRKLSKHFYQGTTGIEPIDDVIHKTNKWGYAHHIERLMLVGNFMLLCEIDPKEVYRWFMEMYVDSSDWVMGPNVYGMSQFSDGGIFATKPYISGSNYVIKMSHYKKGAWSEIWDSLYWNFIDKHRDFFAGNYRLSMMVSHLNKMGEQKIQEHRLRAQNFFKFIES